MGSGIHEKGAPVMRSRRAASVVMRSYMSWVMELRISMAFALMPRSGCTDVSTRRRYDRYESTCLFLRLHTGREQTLRRPSRGVASDAAATSRLDAGNRSYVLSLGQADERAQSAASIVLARMTSCRWHAEPPRTG